VEVTSDVQLTQNAPFGPSSTIAFESIAVGRAPYSGHSEKNFTIVPSDVSWYGSGPSLTHGNTIQFDTESGNTATGKVTITGDGRPFAFSSMSIYSSITQIPWSITGKRNGVVVYQSSATQPNTYGAYVTVNNDHPTTLIDRLELTVTNPLTLATCPSPPCRNPVGLDTIVVSY
jgi:hypothetical protein